MIQHVVLFGILIQTKLLQADIRETLNFNNSFDYPKECSYLLNDYAQTASELTLCSIQYARPIKLCEKCIGNYLAFVGKYADLINKEFNGTSCKSLFISQDRLEIVLEYHNNIQSVWFKGRCNACYDWSNGGFPEVSNDTKKFSKMYNSTMDCISTNIKPNKNNSEEVCEKCMQSYIELDEFYKTLNDELTCMDVVDSMNTTRAIWSKSLNCCKLRRTPELIFLVCTGMISFLPIFFYFGLRYCGPMKKSLYELTQSRFKQTIIRSDARRIN